jgi:hypothetical protein
VRSRLAARAEALGFPPPISVSMILRPGVNTVRVPAKVAELKLLSASGQALGDRRWLGALLTQITLGGEEIALGDDRLARGFHRVEDQNNKRVRWTDGTGVLELHPQKESRVCVVKVAAVQGQHKTKMAG